MQFICKEKEKKNIFPEKKNIFRSFFLTPFENLKVVILGQDPYYNKNKADGLAFSVPKGEKIPPSLKNIIKELKSDLEIEFIFNNNGCLEHWARQGVFLLNTILTVEENKPGSHRNIGWEKFTDVVISMINNYKKGVIFLFWGAYAQKKISKIDFNVHYILKAAHPSPFSANKGFFGCKHFSQVNNILVSRGEKPINWSFSP